MWMFLSLFRLFSLFCWQTDKMISKRKYDHVRKYLDKAETEDSSCESQNIVRITLSEEEALQVKIRLCGKKTSFILNI